MKNQRIFQRVLNIVECVRAVTARVSLLSPRGGLTPAPVPVRRRSGPTRGQASSRRTGWLPPVVGFVLLALAAVPAWAGAPALPAGVPDIYDPAIRAHFQPMAVANLHDNPDFPVIILVNTTGKQPPALLFGVDARNGKDTWSLTTDPIILIAVFADERTLQGVYVDTGFAERGQVSGTFAAVAPANGSTLPEVLKAFTAASKRVNI